MVTEITFSWWDLHRHGGWLEQKVFQAKSVQYAPAYVTLFNVSWTWSRDTSASLLGYSGGTQLASSSTAFQFCLSVHDNLKLSSKNIELYEILQVCTAYDESAKVMNQSREEIMKLNDNCPSYIYLYALSIAEWTNVATEVKPWQRYKAIFKPFRISNSYHLGKNTSSAGLGSSGSRGLWQTRSWFMNNERFESGFILLSCQLIVHQLAANAYVPTIR